MKKQCNRCGQCCANVMLPLSPRELHADWVRWFTDRGPHYRNISILFPSLVYKGYNAHWKRHVYHCTHLRVNKNGKPSCRIHKHRPDMCRDFPYEGSLHMGKHKNNPIEFKGCGYNENKNHGKKHPVYQLNARSS